MHFISNFHFLFYYFISNWLIAGELGIDLINYLMESMVQINTTKNNQQIFDIVHERQHIVNLFIFYPNCQYQLIQI